MAPQWCKTKSAEIVAEFGPFEGTRLHDEQV
jgi:hypothetical protein